jgi:hypothetical protein
MYGFDLRNRLRTIAVGQPEQFDTLLLAMLHALIVASELGRNAMPGRYNDAFIAVTDDRGVELLRAPVMRSRAKMGLGGIASYRS